MPKSTRRSRKSSSWKVHTKPAKSRRNSKRRVSKKSSSKKRRRKSKSKSKRVKKGGNIGWNLSLNNVVGGLPVRNRYNSCGNNKGSNLLKGGSSCSKKH